MNGLDVISRRIEPDGCVAAGTQLAAEAKALESNQIQLHADVVGQIAAVGDWTAKVQTLIGTGSGMWDVDRCTDRALGAFNQALQTKESAFADGEILTITVDEQKRVALAIEVRRAVFPTGTGFLSLPFYKQWVRLVPVSKALQEQKTGIQTLGLSMEADRVQRWIELYGATLGLTKSTDVAVDELAVAVDGWHNAWGELTIAVLYRYKDNSADSEKVRTKLLGPYGRVVEKERAEVRKRRAKRKSDEGEKKDG